MATVLITGVSGFVGSHLLDATVEQKRHHVIGVVRNPDVARRLENRGLDVRVADLVQPSSLQGVTKGVDVVVHLAGRMRFHDPWDVLFANNVEGTKQLALDAVQQGVRHFVYISSTEATGPVDVIPGVESAAYHPSYEYGRSKMLAEQWLRDHAVGLPVTILRPTGIYGPDDTYITLPVLGAVRRGLMRMLPSKTADHYIQFTYVSDVVRGILAAVENPGKAGGETFIVASDDYYSYQDLFSTLAELLDAPRPRVTVPGWLVRGVLRYFEWSNRRKGRDEFIFHGSAVDDMRTNRVYSNAKIKQVLGFAPQYTLRQGIAEILATKEM